MDANIASVLSNSADTAKLKNAVNSGDHHAEQQTIAQFEALFLQNMLKQMRSASLGGDLFASDGQQFYRDMYDQQIATELAGRGILGIGRLLGEQLGVDASGSNRQIMTGSAVPYKARPVYVDPQPSLLQVNDSSGSFEEKVEPTEDTKAALEQQPISVPKSPKEFVDQVKHIAIGVADRLGIDPNAVIGIAALETGWGKHVPADGANGASNNYFGIKADRSWSGQQVLSNTLEHVNGVFEQFRESFRSYQSLADSFNDFADFLLSNPRYQDALDQGTNTEQFLTKLQEAGYATDPNYRHKVMRVIQHALSLQ